MMSVDYYILPKCSTVCGLVLILKLQVTSLMYLQWLFLESVMFRGKHPMLLNILA